MADTPDDLTSVGTHHGNQPPDETGQTVRSPKGPDPNSTQAQASPALFQVVIDSSKNSVSVLTHSARAEVPSPDEADDVVQVHTVEALREALAEAGIDGWTAVFEEVDSAGVRVDPDASPDHVWIGQVRYPTITFFADPEDATAYADRQ